MQFNLKLHTRGRGLTVSEIFRLWGILSWLFVPSRLSRFELSKLRETGSHKFSSMYDIVYSSLYLS